MGEREILIYHVIEYLITPDHWEQDHPFGALRAFHLGPVQMALRVMSSWLAGKGQVYRVQVQVAEALILAQCFQHHRAAVAYLVHCPILQFPHPLFCRWVQQITIVVGELSLGPRRRSIFAACHNFY
jgi:hypothetical protein